MWNDDKKYKGPYWSLCIYSKKNKLIYLILIVFESYILLIIQKIQFFVFPDMNKCCFNENKIKIELDIMLISSNFKNLIVCCFNEFYGGMLIKDKLYKLITQ